MSVRSKILIVEDDKNISAMLAAVLTANGYEPISAASGQAAYSMITSHCPDVILLDLGLPDMDGLSLLQQVRRWSHMPILVISARDRERDKVEALDLGADDYIGKPFGTSELLARIRTAIRHTRTISTDENLARSGKFRAGDLVIDYDKYRAYVAGVDAGLTQNEFKLVALLGKFAGRVLTYDFLIRELWGPNMRGDNQILRVNMANIRRKIERNPANPQYIFTEMGVGYRMVEGDSID